MKMDKKVGFIGCGKMAQAMITGMLHSKLLRPDQIIASAGSKQTLSKVENQFQIKTTLSNQEVAGFSDFLFLAVKPNLYKKVISEIKDYIQEDAIIVTIAAGIDIDFMEREFGKEVKLVRTMPNTPSLVGEGMSAMCSNNQVTEHELEEVMELFKSFGKCEYVDESLMNAIPAISGSAPAYVYMFIEALADGGVRQGIPRDQAYRLAAQAVLGAAKMVVETGKHPGELKDQVCTPGGTTIEAVAALEQSGFRVAILNAMKECTDKANILSRN
jgi:pyrroline-5-carboxylate reductase